MEFGSSIPKKKRKTTTTTTSLNPSLPNDLILDIIARVSRLYYPTLSLVSKSFQSLLTSPEHYKTRSSLGHTESCPYVCFETYTGCSWYTLCRKPDQTLTSQKKKCGGYVLAKVPIPHSPEAKFSGLVAVGSNIYNICVHESHYKASSSTVFVLDCTTHTWREAPRLPEELSTISCSANVLDGKIYVARLSANDENNDCGPFKNSLEVFDTRTQAWDPNPIPCIRGKDMRFRNSLYCLDGKLHMVAGSQVLAYNAKEGRWDRVIRPRMICCMLSASHCEIDNVLYSVYQGAFRWYDTQVRSWRDLKVLVGLPKIPPNAYVRLADYDGKIAVIWSKSEVSFYSSLYDYTIWCAEIALERRTSCEIWGKVEWFDHVLTVPTSHRLVKAVSATV